MICDTGKSTLLCQKDLHVNERHRANCFPSQGLGLPSVEWVVWIRKPSSVDRKIGKEKGWCVWPQFLKEMMAWSPPGRGWLSCPPGHWLSERPAQRDVNRNGFIFPGTAFIHALVSLFPILNSILIRFCNLQVSLGY